MNGVTTENWQEVRKKCRKTLTIPVANYIEGIREKDPQRESQLISVLHRVQAEFGYLSEDHLDAVAQLLQVPAAKVAGVATFYHFFRLQPRGEHKISVCMGTACFVKGAEKIAQKIREELGITFGETSKDGMFSLEASRCLGTCGLAPVIMVDGNVHGPITPDQIPSILESYMQAGVRK